MKLVGTLCGGILILGVSAANASIIEVGQSWFITISTRGEQMPESIEHRNVALPFVHDDYVPYAWTGYNLFAEEEEAGFLFGFEHNVGPHPGDTASSTGRIAFTTLEDEPYSFEAFYGPDGGGDIFLWDNTAGESVFWGESSSSGWLLAAHSYELNYDVGVTGDYESGYSSSGFLDFRITPEPGALSCLVVGVIAMQQRRRRL